uniref:Uncharacterized protein n=3 Tax=Rhodnius prolixus TaxID=13249 RepID=T1HV16_RHOPR
MNILFEKMFSKCIYCDKLHLCTYREKIHRSLITSRRWRERMSEALLPLMITDDRLKGIFHRWNLLTSSEKAAIDEQIEASEYLDIYSSVKEALTRWENIQDVQGAPGFEPGTYAFTCDSRLDEELPNVLKKMELLVKAIYSNHYGHIEDGDVS